MHLPVAVADARHLNAALKAAVAVQRDIFAACLQRAYRAFLAFGRQPTDTRFGIGFAIAHAQRNLVVLHAAVARKRQHGLIGVGVVGCGGVARRAVHQELRRHLAEFNFLLKQTR